MIRFSILLVACVIGSFVQQGQGQDQDQSPSSVPSSTQGLPESSPAEKVDASQNQQAGEQVADIMAIRDQLGGGVAEVLGDFSLEMPGKKQGQENEEPSLSLEQQFRAALARQAQAQEADSEPAAEQEFVLSGTSNELVEPSERQEIVWEAARQLEEVAAILEEVHEYDRADQLRQTALELWKSVRR